MYIIDEPIEADVVIFDYTNSTSWSTILFNTLTRWYNYRSEQL